MYCDPGLAQAKASISSGAGLLHCSGESVVRRMGGNGNSLSGR